MKDSSLSLRPSADIRASNQKLEEALWQLSSGPTLPSPASRPSTLNGFLLDQLNELRSALVHGADPAHIRPLIRQVNQSFHLHIQSEARLLAVHQFPGLAEYNTECHRLFERLAIFDLRFEQHQVNAVYELVEYLRKWFCSHTCGSTQDYAHWLRTTGAR